MRNAIFLGHLGLGDHLILNGLIRHITPSWNNFIVLAKHHNVASCRFMWSDLANVQVVGIADDNEARGVCNALPGYKTLHNGSFAVGFSFDCWDRSFYEQAGIPFEQSWEGWRVPECKTPIETLGKPYIFVHEDRARGYCIDESRLPEMPWRVSNTDHKSKHIFEWVEILRGAQEIHVMESCFAILADRLDGLKARRLVVHGYMRNSRPPVYRKTWEILR